VWSVEQEESVVVGKRTTRRQSRLQRFNVSKLQRSTVSEQ
jgi:hypothetical protein